jgi:hypothetical protein
MTKVCCATCALVFLATWPLGRIEAEPRCYPLKRFVPLAGGLVSDALTGLVWQQQASPKNMTWAEARTYCPSGYRLPTVKELTSIVDFTVTSPPAIDQTAFPGAPRGPFWTSSPYAKTDVSAAWAVDFYTGSWTFSNADGNLLIVRCVR